MSDYREGKNYKKEFCKSKLGNISYKNFKINVKENNNNFSITIDSQTSLVYKHSVQ